MGGRITYILLLLLGQFFCSSGSSVTKIEAIGHTRKLLHEGKKLEFSTTQRDITTPITTVPTIIPTNPTSSTTIINPNSTPESSPATSITPTMNPTTTSTTTPTSSGVSWCVASQSVSQTALQVALDYACGYGGADCSAIQPGGSCFNPNTIRDHASYAFNNYYQKNPVPTSCNFGGTAVTTSSDPSIGTCQYPPISTSSSVLNTTNSNGATVFGAVPSGPSTSAAPNFNRSLHYFLTLTCFMLMLVAKCFG